MLEENGGEPLHSAQRSAEVVGDGVNELFKLGVGVAEFGGAILNAAFEAGEDTLALDEEIADFELFAAGTSSHVDGVNEGVRTEGALEKSDYAGGVEEI